MTDVSVTSKIQIMMAIVQVWVDGEIERMFIDFNGFVSLNINNASIVQLHYNDWRLIECELWYWFNITNALGKFKTVSVFKKMVK